LIDHSDFGPRFSEDAMNRFAANATIAALAQLCVGLSAHAGGSADLGVTVAGPTQSPAGLQVNYPVTITNNGPDAATGVEPRAS
jgi:hypothetical protein